MRSFSNQLDSFQNNNDFFASSQRINVLQSIPHHAQTTYLNNENVVNPFGVYNATTGKFTVPQDMTITSTFFCILTGLTPGVGQFHVRYAIDGSLVVYPYWGFAIETAEPQVVATVQLRLTAGQTFEWVVYQNNGAARNSAGHVSFKKG